MVRLEGDYVPFRAGQSVSVTVPRSPHLPRRYSPALPPSLDGKFEFHIRKVAAGWVSGPIVEDTRVGDVWQIDDPRGELSVDDSDRDVVMIAGGTGLAPMRALVLDLGRRDNPPRVHLIIGGRSPRDLYAADMLWMLEGQAPWLTVVPVVDSLDELPFRDPWFERAEIERVAGAPDAGFGIDEIEVGRIDEVVAKWGPYLDHQVLLCGSPRMADATVRALVDGGTPRNAILL